MRLKNRVVVITGASAGIGRSIAELLSDRGARVFAIARNEERLARLTEGRTNITAIVGDMTSDEQRARIAAQVGDVDVLINNAGIGHYGDAEKMAVERVRELCELNIVALMDMTHRLLPGLRERRGHIVNMGSTAGYVALTPLVVYGATKFAVRGYTNGLRRELAGTGVTVSLIAPGPIKTGFNNRARVGNRLDIPDEGSGGVPVEYVAKAVERSITRRRIPGYSTVSVPRAFGIARVAELPLFDKLVDVLAPSVARAMRSL